MYEIAMVGFGCSLIVFGFIQEAPNIFRIEEDGEIHHCQNFSAIGTGSVIAHTALYQREQKGDSSIEETLYNLYEASRLARIAPGVGEIGEFAMFEPSTRTPGIVRIRITKPNYLAALA